MSGGLESVERNWPAAASFLLACVLAALAFGGDGDQIIIAGLGFAGGVAAINLVAAIAGGAAPIWLYWGAGLGLTVAVAEGTADAFSLEGFAAGGVWLAAFVLAHAVARVRVPLTLCFNAATTIACPRLVAFETLRYRPTTNFYKPYAKRVELDPSGANRFRQYFTVPGVETGAYLTVEVSDLVEGERFTTRLVASADAHDQSGGEDETETLFFADAPRGLQLSTRIALRRARLDTILQAVLLRPHCDQLIQIKAMLEARRDDSIAATFTQTGCLARPN